ncbi:hypothetical protein [Acidiphilium angustum]|uniref:hypothetical protein n=1 Tax=Acidiphilium angustum TaxID=523 RepID=UPI000493C9FF|nr:hypothetical protein [Acidiphilium angustum]
MPKGLAQPDLFGPNFTDVRVGRPSRVNPRCIAHEDCHWEEYECEKRGRFEIGIGRTQDGYVYSHGCQHGAGGWGGPVFAHTERFPSFFVARQRALDDLAERVSILKSEHNADIVAKNRAAILKKIEEIR